MRASRAAVDQRVSIVGSSGLASRTRDKKVFIAAEERNEPLGGYGLAVASDLGYVLDDLRPSCREF